jgi:hypothetical protein
MFATQLFIAGIAALAVTEGVTLAQATEPASAPVVTSPREVPASADPWQSGTGMVAFNLGLGSAVGLAGVTYSHMLLSVLEAEAGVGVGLSGVQVSLMQKIALGGPSFRLVAGVGVSFSAGNSLGDDTRTHYFWLNVDALGFEVRTRSQWDFSLALGVTHVFGKPIWVMGDCERPQNCSGDSTFPEIRMGVGRWF